MEFAFWSLAYVVPLVLYVWYLLAAKQNLWDPLALGGLFLFGMFALTDPLDHTIPQTDLLVLHAACSVAYWLGGGAGRWVGVFRRTAGNEAVRIEARASLWLWLILSALAVTIFIFATTYDLSLDVLLQMRNRTNLRLGAIDTGIGIPDRIALYARGYLAPLMTLGLLFWCRRGRPSLGSSLLVAASLGMWALISLGGGSRGAILFMFIECAFAVAYAASSTGRLQVGPRVLVAVLLPVGIITVITQTLYRDTGVQGTETVSELTSRTGEVVMTMADHLSFNDEVAFVIANYPSVYEYTRGQSLFAPLLFMVPRIWWPSKPVPWGRVLAWQHGFRYTTTVSMAATIPGEGYANFGVAGWVLFPLGFGFAIGWTSQRLRHPANEIDLVVGMWSLFWALCLRGDIYTAMVSIVAPALVVILAVCWLGCRKTSVPVAEQVARALWNLFGGSSDGAVTEAAGRHT